MRTTVCLLLAITVHTTAAGSPTPPLPATGAAIDAEARTTATFHLATDGDDANDGSSARPFATLQHALDSAMASKRQGIATRLVIAAGVYRQVASWDEPILNGVPIVIEAAVSGTVVIDGSDRWSDWQPDGESWHKPWPYDWGIDLPFDGIASVYGRYEMVFVNDRLLRQVTTADELAAGTFFIDDDNDRIMLQTESGIDPNRAQTRVSVRGQLLRLANVDAVVLRGIKFVRSRVGSPGPVKFQDCRNVLIEDCDFSWHTKTGSRMNRCEDFTFRRVSSNYNGRQGFFNSHNRNFLYVDCEQSHNGWRADLAGRGGWDTSKWLHARRFTLRNFTAVGNLSPGIWFDMDHEDVLIESALVVGNRGRGIFLEAGQGPYAVTDSIIMNTEPVPAGYRYKFMAGLSLSTVSDVTIERNIIVNNVDRPEYGINAQVQLHDLPGRKDIKSTETGELVDVSPLNIKISRNAIITASPRQTLLAMPPTDARWSSFYPTFDSNQNLYWNLATGNDRSGFKFVKGLGEHTSPPTIVAEMSLAGWQKATGQDRLSVFADPGFADPLRGDFTIDNASPLAGWGLPARRIDPTLLNYHRRLAAVPQALRQSQMLPTPSPSAAAARTRVAPPPAAATGTEAAPFEASAANTRIEPALWIRLRDNMGDGVGRRGNQVESPAGAMRVGDANNNDEFRLVAAFDLAEHRAALRDASKIMLTAEVTGNQWNPGPIAVFALKAHESTSPDHAAFEADAEQLPGVLTVDTTGLRGYDVTEQVKQDLTGGVSAFRFQGIGNMPNADSKGENIFIASDSVRLRLVN